MSVPHSLSLQPLRWSWPLLPRLTSVTLTWPPLLLPTFPGVNRLCKASVMLHTAPAQSPSLTPQDPRQSPNPLPGIQDPYPVAPAGPLSVTIGPTPGLCAGHTDLWMFSLLDCAHAVPAAEKTVQEEARCPPGKMRCSHDAAAPSMPQEGPQTHLGPQQDWELLWQGLVSLVYPCVSCPWRASHAGA